MATAKENKLGVYLRSKREKLDSAALGYPQTRRRTPGLRREEVAQRANVSITWYTLLERGRGGAPSASVIDRIARALLLTDAEREHVFLLALGRPPEPHYLGAQEVTPRLQRLLDVLETSPALIRTATWDVVAWNRAASVVLSDYGSLEPSQRNILKLMFANSRVRSAQTDWEGVARFVVAAFRAETARAGATESVKSLVDELSAVSPEFEMMWRENDVRVHGEGTKKLHHPIAGTLTMEYSGFSVDSRPNLSMVVYNPATPEDAEKIKLLLARAGKTPVAKPAGKKPAKRKAKKGA
ncbi:MAG: helix-turn-helix transcriptional regulator [Micavibrio sp.]|nr:helix-turn-helix transcriptional regulator [Micavibrio sp.]